MLFQASATWLSLRRGQGVLELLSPLLCFPLHLESLKHPASLWRNTLAPDAAGNTARGLEALGPLPLALSSALS